MSTEEDKKKKFKIEGGYNSQGIIDNRTETGRIKEGYNGTQMVNTRNEPPPPPPKKKDTDTK